MSHLGSLYSESSTVENKLFHSPWRWWLSLSEQAHVTVIEFTSEIQIYEWSSFREKAAGIKHRLGVKVQSKRSKSRMALKFSQVLRKSVFSPSPFQMGAIVLWCAWLFWGNSIWAWIRTGMACKFRENPLLSPWCCPTLSGDSELGGPSPIARLRAKAGVPGGISSEPA